MSEVPLYNTVNCGARKSPGSPIQSTKNIEVEMLASVTLGRSQDVCKGARSIVEGERCVVSS